MIKTTNELFITVTVALAVVLLAHSTLTFAQGVLIVPVRSVGQGQTESDAIKDAVLQGIAQVTGQRIQSRESSSETSLESSGEKGKYSADFQRKVDALIRGVVKSHRVVSVNFDNLSSLYKAVVEVQVAKYQQSQQLGRYRVAVVSGVTPEFAARLGPAVLKEIVSAASEVIVRSHKFAVLDRVENDLVQNEFARISSERSAIEEGARLNVRAAADFLVIINVLKISTTPGSSERLSASGRIQLLDYASGQTRYSGTRTISGVLSQSRGVSTIVGRLASSLAGQMMEYGFPAEVISNSGDTLTVDAGSNRFAKDDIVGIYRKGPDLKDSHTGEAIGGSEELVAKGVIVSASERVSLVRVTEGLTKIESPGGKAKMRFIVRLESRDVSNLAASVRGQILGGNDKKSDDDEW
jgi:hypothetical protein